MSAPTVEAPAAAHLPATAEGRRLQLVNLVLELRAFIALIVLIIVFSILSDSYLTWDNLVTMTRHVAINAILAIGMLMVILTGGHRPLGRLDRRIGGRHRRRAARRAHRRLPRRPPLPARVGGDPHRARRRRGRRARSTGRS